MERDTVFLLNLFLHLHARAEYNAKIRAAFLMAPPVFFEYSFSPVFLLTPFKEEIEQILLDLGDKKRSLWQIGFFSPFLFADIYEVLRHRDLYSAAGHQLCTDEHFVT